MTPGILRKIRAIVAEIEYEPLSRVLIDVQDASSARTNPMGGSAWKHASFAMFGDI
jgi:hypothetical protein